jgi:hypothetical protein
MTGWQIAITSLDLHGPMSSLLQDRRPFMPARTSYCGFRVDIIAGPAKLDIELLTLQTEALYLVTATGIPTTIENMLVRKNRHSPFVVLRTNG